MPKEVYENISMRVPKVVLDAMKDRGINRSKVALKAFKSELDCLTLEEWREITLKCLQEVENMLANDDRPQIKEELARIRSLVNRLHGEAYYIQALY